ncbi:MAG: acyl carrier protein [Bacteroidales bacterium]|nr:acyl carrier protein [Bacteroidales bacterium]MBR6277320.1 acyl carrier protein [Bacteroidales bacterium]
MEELITELKKEIIKTLNLEEIKVEDIKNDEPLFGSGLGLDSIDALELIVMMEKKYGIKLKDVSQGKKIFTSVNTMAEYVKNNRQK